MKLDLFFFLCLFELILQEVQPNIVYLYWNGTNPQMHLSVHSLNNNRVSLYVDGIYTKI